jgi:hypothetical protein
MPYASRAEEGDGALASRGTASEVKGVNPRQHL